MRAQKSWWIGFVGLALSCESTAPEAIQPQSQAAFAVPLAAAKTPDRQPLGDSGETRSIATTSDVTDNLDAVPSLTLLATIVHDDPAVARATIRDDVAGKVSMVRVGDIVGPGGRVIAIGSGEVTLDTPQGRQRLVMGEAPVTLAADDVFYPDLVEVDLPDQMVDAVPMPAGPRWRIKNPELAWGTPRTVHRLREAMLAYANRVEGGPDIHIGDLSKKGGGVLPPHVSHRSGRDVDIGYVLVGADADVSHFVPAQPRNLDRARTWELLRILLESRAIGWIFMDYQVQGWMYDYGRGAGTQPDRLDAWFQYPHGPRAARGVIRDWPGHGDHFHVRFAK